MIITKKSFLLFILFHVFRSLAIPSDTLIQYYDYKAALKVKEQVYYLEYGCDEKDKSVYKEFLKFNNLHTFKINTYNVDMDALLLTISKLPKLKKLIINAESNDSFKELSSLKQITSLEIFGKIDEFPNSLISLTQLEELKISAKLTSVSENIYKLKRIRHLDLKYNDLKKLPNAVCRLTNLKELNLLGNYLLVVPDSIENLSLTTLDLEMAVDSFPLPITRIKTLENLKITQKNLKQLPTCFNSLENLKSLTIDIHLKTNWNKTFTTLSSMPNLKHLNLFQYSIYPKEIALLKNITHLEVTGNVWGGHNGASAYVLGNISGMAHLESLIFNCYNDSLVSPLIKNLEYLKTLEFRRAFLTQLPEEIGMLTHLERLYIKKDVNMHLKRKWTFKIPSAIGNLKNLQHLEFCNLPISELPIEIGNLEALRFASFHSCQLHSIPQEITQLKNIEELALDLNYLKELPVGFGNLQKLKSLDLSYNRLNNIDSEVFNLENLECLYAASLTIDSLSEFIQRLKNLKVLDLRDNYIAYLPSNISKMYKLQKIFLSDNYITNRRKINQKVRKKIIWSNSCGCD